MLCNSCLSVIYVATLFLTLLKNATAKIRRPVEIASYSLDGIAKENILTTVIKVMELVETEYYNFLKNVMTATLKTETAVRPPVL